MNLRIAAPILTAALVACAASPPVDYAAPLTARQAAYEQAFAGRPCALSAAQCQCQIDVFARNMTPSEMQATQDVTFGDSAAKVAAARPALDALNRILPERRRVCGF